MSVCNSTQYYLAQLMERVSAAQDEHRSLSNKTCFIGFSIGFYLLFSLLWFSLVGLFATENMLLSMSCDSLKLALTISVYIPYSLK